jgi:DNA-binding Lrp family transcriptional regulator
VDRAGELDEVDRRLVHRLAEGVEADLRTVARDVGIAEEEARDRVARLRSNGTLREVAARIDPSTVGLPVTAFLVLRVAQNRGNYEAIRQVLRDCEQVEEAHAVSGSFDWLVKVRASSLEQLQHLVVERISLLPGYIRAEAWVVLDTACDHVNAEAVTLAGD